MGQSKLVIALFLACAFLALSPMSQLASGQSITTLSTVQSFTSTAVIAVTSTLSSTVGIPQTVHYDLTPSDFNNKTGTFTLGYSELGTAPYYTQNALCLMYDYFLLNATTAYQFKIHFDTQQNIPVHFLILDMEQFNQFNHINCANQPFGYELRIIAPAADQVWIAPQSGEYVLLFLSRQFLGGYVHLTVQAYSQAIQTSTSAYTTTSIIQVLSAQTTISTLPEAIIEATTPSNYTALIGGAIIIAIVLLTAAMLSIKRRSKAR